MANAEEGGLATSQQIISKASITQVHLNTSRCLKATACSGSGYFFLSKNIFKTGCSKRDFLSD